MDHVTNDITPTALRLRARVLFSVERVLCFMFTMTLAASVYNEVLGLACGVVATALGFYALERNTPAVPDNFPDGYEGFFGAIRVFYQEEALTPLLALSTMFPLPLAFFLW